VGIHCGIYKSSYNVSNRVQEWGEGRIKDSGGGGEFKNYSFLKQ
jgi:hypothetical protein